MTHNHRLTVVGMALAGLGVAVYSESGADWRVGGRGGGGQQDRCGVWRVEQGLGV